MHSHVRSIVRVDLMLACAALEHAAHQVGIRISHGVWDHQFIGTRGTGMRSTRRVAHGANDACASQFGHLRHVMTHRR